MAGRWSPAVNDERRREPGIDWAAAVTDHPTWFGPSFAIETGPGVVSTHRPG
ncbi:MAG: hypothetical protein M3457_19700 [Chloroflexota bacterium]|nr:hypothetical protein [Chloroflexota bacterium]